MTGTLSPTVLLFIALGGALGSVARYLLSVAADAYLGQTFAWGTLIVNVVGCGLAGMITGMIAEGAELNPSLRAYIMVGLLGGFTTFSAFSADTWHMWEHSPVLAVFYGGVTIGLTVFSFALMFAAGRSMVG
ncbi:MAG: CrcB family protein [Alphaproteobacteria bacterium]|nr:CrcB family protein [Alphaproteobacteria bacterium]